MSDFTMTIDSEQVASNEWIPVEDPSTGTVFARAPQCTPEQLDAAMASAARAQITWAADEPARQEALRRCAATLNANNEAIAQVLTAEQGKPITESRRETAAAAAWFDYYANLDRRSEIVQDDARAHISVDRRPLGVVAAITPWNFPVMLSSWKVAPALRAGNTVVLKPSPFTPLTALLIGKLLADELPAGALNVVTGGNQLGNLVTTHPIPRKISFTGSTPTGIKVATAAAATLKRVTLELGGNDAAIVLDDVDPGAIAEKLFWSAFINNGQACVAIKRLYVPQSSYGKFVDALAAVAEAQQSGAGIEPDTTLGPINNRPQFERVAGLVEDARTRGARIATGGIALDRPGHFYRPTILADVPDSAPIAAEEQFGPALPVLPYTTVDDAVARANDTRFGLAGSVWGGDQDQARAVADRLEAGIVWVNTHAAPSLRAPFSGVKDSGLGVENGPWGLDGFTELHTTHVARR
ncbi:aldehyde dehydrogenase family protein [Antrihabitans stalactiti]|uniref:Aldehyde dehydrogenase family protein n=1 Tax=Antrihabitans stalactiti TaxID=2584121 RepID=A0A848KJ51_9NOCA|nr:aldehyde dehydrogenase family protein [Antrihabitans stalactiti]NMN96702.1 aldehyde dehydrogenase family protein [Antrihabitans stalactiti]